MPVLSRPSAAGRRGRRGPPGRARGGAPASQLGPSTGRSRQTVPGSAGAAAREGRRRGLAQPRPVPGPIRSPSPTGPALRANPFPEVTDPDCRLPLPTLFYRQRLFTLETCCGYGYGPARKSHRLPRFFKGRRERTRQRKSRAALREPRALSPSESIPGRPPPYKEKRTLPGAPAGVTWCVCVAALAPLTGRRLRGRVREY